jgi:hypothetical protein
MSYAELQVTMHFSFLRGASSPEELFSAAAPLGISALGVSDRNSLAGIVRAYEAAKVTGVNLIVAGSILRISPPFSFIPPIACLPVPPSHDRQGARRQGQMPALEASSIPDTVIF